VIGTGFVAGQLHATTTSCVGRKGRLTPCRLAKELVQSHVEC
jgi:hypothetical protein